MHYQKLLLRAGKEYLLYHNHPWIFSQAFQEKQSFPKDGAITDTFDSSEGKFLARGYYNSKSQIAFRILTRNPSEKIDASFFEKRFSDLFALRQRFIDTKQTNAFRVVFGESDNLPGLVIDKYDSVFVLQIHTLGMEQLREPVLSAMKKIFKPETIFERSDVGVRLQEGLKDLPVRHLFGKKIQGEIEIREHGLRFLVNVEKGQKTGFFLDQRDNRKALQRYAAGKRVLNCFCYTAGFSVYAAAAGAKETVNVDVSKEALKTAQRNFTINNIAPQKHQFIDDDVFDALAAFGQKKKQFDIIILDPPAFVKNKKSLGQGLKGYLFINEKALMLLPNGGILVSSSCSAHVTDELFQKMLLTAASRAQCSLKTLEIRHQPIDHPYNIHFPEGKYLKFYVMLKT